MHIMKRLTIIFGALALLLGVVNVQCEARHSILTALSDTTALVPTEEMVKEAQVVTSVLDRTHYRKVPLNDSLSVAIFDNYIDALDRYKVYFLQSDLDEFEEYKTELDDAIREGDLTIPFTIYNRYRKRFDERLQVADSLSQVEYDFTIDEYYDSERNEGPWAASAEELDEVWRKIIKSQALSYRLAGKEWEEIHENLEKRYDRLDDSMDKAKASDVFQSFMNAYTTAYDPHTSYFTPATRDNFEIAMSKSLEGIGASLQTDGDYTKVANIIAGGPAFKSKLLQKADRIIGVAQGEDGEMVDVIGWRIDDVVKLIRGDKGSIVRLSVLKASDGANAVPVEIELVRDEVKLEDQVAKSKMVPFTQGEKTYNIGVITIPDFYMDFKAMQAGDPNYNSTTRDVKRLIQELEADGMDALVIDLTYNGGGSLTEAIDLTGLFIPKGPVVQVKNTDGSVQTGDDEDGMEFYEGPMAVVVNRFSASASEIFAGAIQDYQRGLVIGERTYGKGTVQNLVDLNRVIRGANTELGELKITLAKFYRVTGSSTQHKGVMPDISLPSEFGEEEFGESSNPSALPWDQIEASRFKATRQIDPGSLENLRNKYQDWLQSDEELIALAKDIEESRKARNETRISLNLEKRKEELGEDAAEPEELVIAGELDEEEEDEEKEEKLDPYVKESVRILSEWVRMNDKS